MALVGYFEGTSPDLLTTLVARGHQTLPLSNGLDQYGVNALELTKDDGVDIIVGYLHKVMTADSIGTTTDEILGPSTKLNIPVFLMIPAEEILTLKKRLSKLSDTARFIEPSHALREIEEYLKYRK